MPGWFGLSSDLSWDEREEWHGVLWYGYTPLHLNSFYMYRFIYLSVALYRTVWHGMAIHSRSIHGIYFYDRVDAMRCDIGSWLCSE
jgi:hypothetical protein